LDAFAVFTAHCQVAFRDNGPLALALFMAGLVGSAGHCAGMCGPFVLAQIGARAGLQRLGGSALLPYHLGRGTTYIGLGALLAAPIGLLSRLDDLRWIPVAMLVSAAALFIAQALRGWNLVGGWSPGFLQFARGLFARPIGVRGYALGLLLGFLPCGLLYAALGAAAASGDPIAAATGMTGFVLGTVPMLLAIGLLGHGATKHWRAHALKAMPIVAGVNAVVLLAMAWRIAVNT
jgi:sulfite exporter TauE/SafE